MWLETTNGELVNLDRLIEISILEIKQPAGHHVFGYEHAENMDAVVTLYDDSAMESCERYLEWLKQAIKHTPPDARIIRNTFPG